MDRSIHRLKLLYDGQEWNLKTHKDVHAESGRDLRAGIGCKIIFFERLQSSGCAITIFTSAPFSTAYPPHRTDVSESFTIILPSICLCPFARLHVLSYSVLGPCG